MVINSLVHGYFVFLIAVLLHRRTVDKQTGSDRYSNAQESLFVYDGNNSARYFRLARWGRTMFDLQGCCNAHSNLISLLQMICHPYLRSIALVVSDQTCLKFLEQLSFLARRPLSGNFSHLGWAMFKPCKAHTAFQNIERSPSLPPNSVAVCCWPDLKTRHSLIYVRSRS